MTGPQPAAAKAPIARGIWAAEVTRTQLLPGCEAFNSILKGILADIFEDDVDVGYTKAFDQAACDFVFGPALMDQLPRPA